MPNYECHFTFLPKDKHLVEPYAEKLKWKVSEIEADPLLGKDTYLYATKHSSTLEGMYVEMDQFHRDLPEDVLVLRRKIEKVIYDERY